MGWLLRSPWPHKINWPINKTKDDNQLRKGEGIKMSTGEQLKRINKPHVSNVPTISKTSSRFPWRFEFHFLPFRLHKIARWISVLKKYLFFSCRCQSYQQILWYAQARVFLSWHFDRTSHSIQRMCRPVGRACYRLDILAASTERQGSTTRRVHRE